MGQEKNWEDGEGGGSQDTSLDRIARKVIVHKDQLIY